MKLKGKEEKLRMEMEEKWEKKRGHESEGWKRNKFQRKTEGRGEEK